MRTYKTEHPHLAVDEKFIAQIEMLGFEDISWHNDICPSFIYEGVCVIVVWVDALDIEQRQDEYTQFGVEVFKDKQDYDEKYATGNPLNFESEFAGNTIDYIINTINFGGPIPVIENRGLWEKKDQDTDHYFMTEAIDALMDTYKREDSFWGSAEEIAFSNLLYAFAEKCGLWNIDDDANKYLKHTPEELLEVLKNRIKNS